MSGSLIPNGKQQYFDANGTPLAGGKVYYYIPYTTTAKNTWQDINLSILNTNPIILDAAGECIAWGSGAYRQQVYDVNNNLIWDQYTYGISPTGSNFISQEEVQTATQGQTAFSLATLTYTPGINSLVVFVNGSKQLVGTNYTETSGTVVTFASGLNAGDVVDFYASLPATAQNMSNAVTVAYDPPFTNSVATNVQAKLAQMVSVKDFGAVGDGVTDDTTAIQNANIVGGFIFPSGTYLVTSNITITNAVNFLPGAVIKPASGIKITMKGSVIAEVTKIIDISAGGHVDFRTGKTISAPVEWWGAIADWNGTTGTDNTNYIQEAWNYGPFELRYPAMAQYYVTGLITSAINTHQHIGAGTSNNLGIVGLGIAAVYPVTGDISATAKYVIQNGIQGIYQPDIFQNLRVVATTDSATSKIIAFGVLNAVGAANDTLQFGFKTINCSFWGYIGWHYQWENGASHTNSIFLGYYAAVAASWPTSSASSSTIQKIQFISCFLFQTTAGYTANQGSLLYQLQGVGNCFITSWQWNDCAFEYGYTGLVTDGFNQFNSCHIERINASSGGAYGLYLIERASATSLFYDMFCDVGLDYFRTQLGSTSILRTGSTTYTPHGYVKQSSNGQFSVIGNGLGDASGMATTGSGLVFNVFSEASMYYSSLAPSAIAVAKVYFPDVYYTGTIEVDFGGMNTSGNTPIAASIKRYFSVLNSVLTTNTALYTDFTTGTTIALTATSNYLAVTVTNTSSANVRASFTVRVLGGGNSAGSAGINLIVFS